MGLKPDRNRDMAAFIAAVEQNRAEMLKAFRRAEDLFAARKSAEETRKKVKNRKSSDRGKP